MKKIVRLIVIAVGLLTLWNPQARIVSAQVSPPPANVEVINTETEHQVLHFIDENDPMFNEVFYYLGVDEDLDRLMFEKFPILTIGVTKKYTDASLIPETIYYHSFGYTGYIPKVSQVKQTEEGLFEVEYIGLVFRDGPVND